MAKKDIKHLQDATKLGTIMLINTLNEVLKDKILRGNNDDDSVLIRRIMTELTARAEAGTLNTIA